MSLELQKLDQTLAFGIPILQRLLDEREKEER
jgi:superfamily II DNA/RNA helicase